MKKESIIRAWKDPAYRESLSPEQRAQVPEHPSGVMELDEATLVRAVGAGLPGRLDPLKQIERIANHMTVISVYGPCPSYHCPYGDPGPLG